MVSYGMVFKNFDVIYVLNILTGSIYPSVGHLLTSEMFQLWEKDN